MLEKNLESPLECKEIKPVNPKGNHSWIFIERTDAEAEAPILWPPNGKSRLIGKDQLLGKTEGKRRWGWSKTRWLDGISNLMNMSLSRLWEMVKDRRSCRAAWGLKESDTTEQLNKCHLGSPFLKISVYFCLYLNCFVYMKAKTRMERGIWRFENTSIRKLSEI